MQETNMQRSWPTILLLALVLALAASAASKGSETKGKYYFKQNCKTCHTKGATGGEITPLNKKMAQWTSYFQAGKHAHGKEPLTKYVSEEQLRDVQAFLTNHAADSLQPETCGKD
jgi:mono/diheme cytochrome c family protein